MVGNGTDEVFPAGYWAVWVLGSLTVLTCQGLHLQASLLPAWRAYLHAVLPTVLRRGSTACQQIRIHRSISSMPPTITSSFWSLMIYRAGRSGGEPM